MQDSGDGLDARWKIAIGDDRHAEAVHHYVVEQSQHAEDGGLEVIAINARVTGGEHVRDDQLARLGQWRVDARRLYLKKNKGKNKIIVHYKLAFW